MIIFIKLRLLLKKLLNVSDSILLFWPRLLKSFLRKKKGIISNNEIYVFSRDECKHWTMQLQYNNNINFSLKIVAKNDVFKKGTFKLPEIN